MTETQRRLQKSLTCEKHRHAPCPACTITHRVCQRTSGAPTNTHTQYTRTQMGGGGGGTDPVLGPNGPQEGGLTLAAKSQKAKATPHYQQ